MVEANTILTPVFSCHDNRNFLIKLHICNETSINSLTQIFLECDPGFTDSEWAGRVEAVMGVVPDLKGGPRMSAQSRPQRASRGALFFKKPPVHSSRSGARCGAASPACP